MARAVISDPKRRAAFEPIYDADPQTGASIEVFFADHWLARSFGTSGWFWWTLSVRLPARSADWPIRDQLRRLSQCVGWRKNTVCKRGIIRTVIRAGGLKPWPSRT